MQGVLSDYVHARTGRGAVNGALLVLAAAFLAIGTSSIVQAAAGVTTVDRFRARPGSARCSTCCSARSRPSPMPGLRWSRPRSRSGPRAGCRSSGGGFTASGHGRCTGRPASAFFLFLLVHVFDLALFPLAPDVYNATVASYANPT